MRLTRHSPPHHLTTSPLTAHHLTTLPLTAHRSPLTAQRSPLTTHHLTTSPRPLASQLIMQRDAKQEGIHELEIEVLRKLRPQLEQVVWQEGY